MIRANVKVCNDCAPLLIIANPCVDTHGNPVSMLKARLTHVEPSYCELHKLKGKDLVLTAIRCGTCHQDFYMHITKGKRVTCPACSSTFITVGIVVEEGIYD